MQLPFGDIDGDLITVFHDGQRAAFGGFGAGCTGRMTTFSFSQTFGLKPDTFYPKMVKIANGFVPDKQYSTQEILTLLEIRHRNPKLTNAEWGAKASKTIDYLVYYDLLRYEAGYYYRTNNI